MEFLREPFRQIKNRTQSRSRSRSKGTIAPNSSDSKPGQDDACAYEEVAEGYGLLLLNPDSDAISANYERVYEVDVVAVHGLGGRRLKTWRNDRGEIWLQKWLPDSIPGARVYTYGYDSGPVFSGSKLGIEDFARGLLDDLTHRSSGKQLRRLIFVCHSLGGIVCKRALLMARENPHYLHIYEQTLGILFFGTPHRGTEKADLVATVAAILNASEALTRRPALRKDLIGTLQPHSWYLESISEAFSHRIRDFEIVTFYEGHSLPPYKDELVPRSSAFIHDEIKIPMNGDHHQICKFETETCYKYQKVVQNIQRILDKLESGLETPTASAAPTKKALKIEPAFIRDEDESDILSTIDTSDISYYKENLPVAVDGTCMWLVEDAVFLSWLNQKPSSLLWITGHPGCGKSMLAAFMVDYLKSKSRIPATVCYFFIVDNIDHQNNSLGILRSVIAQFLRQRRDLIHHARKFVKRRQLHRLEVMWDLFITLISDASAGITTLIIDALDECDEESRNQLLRLIGRIFDKRSSDARLGKARLKLVITSRRDPSLEVKLSSLPIIRLELENHKAVGQAIGLYIHAKVAELMRITGYTKDTAMFIEKQLQVKAENTYLWVKLVFENMERIMSERGGASIKDYQEIVKSLPLEVQSLYASILRSIRTEERSHAAQLLQITTMAFRPLTIKELNIIVQLLKWHSQTLSELNEETQGNFERALDCLRGFVRVADSKIYLIHQSAKEFLTRISERPVPGIVPEFSVLSADAHLQLADACISFLMLREFEQPLLEKHASHAAESFTAYQETHREDPLAPTDNDGGFGLAEIFGDDLLSKGVEHVACTHTFFDYAALNWAKHFTMCEAIAPSELLNKYILISTMDGTHRLMNWLRYLWYSKTYDPCPEYFNPLIVAAYFGHGTVLRHLLETCGATYSLETKNLAISWASRMGHAQVVHALLTEGADGNSTVGGWTPLTWAAHFGNLDAVRVFMRSGKAFLNTPDWKGRTPLSLAAAGGYLDIVKELSSLEGITIDIPDVGGVTPLFKTVTEGHFEVVHWMLQDGRSNVNHQDRTGQTMLFSAAEYGFKDIVELLLTQERLNPNIRDETGRSALSWAAAKAPLVIVQTLASDERVDLHSIDRLGRNALCWSCWSSDTRVLEFFTAIDPHNVDLPATDDGCTPLHFIVVAGRTHAVHSIRILLATGSVDIDSKDHAGRTALSHAASGGQLDLVQLLIENGADMDMVDVMGMSPMNWALSVNAESVVQYLESRKR